MFTRSDFTKIIKGQCMKKGFVKRRNSCEILNCKNMKLGGILIPN